MATTTWQPISIRDGSIDAFPGSTGPATAIYHGSLACVNSSGFVENYTSTSLPKVIGVAYNIAGDASQDGDTITTQGSVNNGSNLVQLYTEGRIDSIPFNADLSADDVGKYAYAIDNFTLTPDPAASTFMSPVGVITKYYSASKGEVKLQAYSNDGLFVKTGILTTSSSSIFMAIPNPLGVDVNLVDFKVVVTTATSSAHAMSVGIAATSTTPAADVVATGGLALGTAGVYGTAKTTNFFGNILWGATKFLTISSSSVITTVPVGYYKLTYEVK